MNKGIAHQLMLALAGLPGISLTGGLVDIQEQVQLLLNEEDGSRRNVTLRYPVTADFMPVDACATGGGLRDMTPSDRETGILFFEGANTAAKGREGRHYAYQSRLRLLVWLNTQAVQVAASAPPAPQSGSIQDLPSLLVNDIVRRFDNLFGKQVGQYTNFRARLSQVYDSGKNLFSAYTFDAATSQYLMPPYLAIGADVLVDYFLHQNCLQNLAVATAPQC